jgi:hypothetical protein
MTDIATVMNMFEQAPALPTTGDYDTAAEGSMQPLCYTKCEKDIVSLIEKYALKDLEQYTANLRVAATLRQGPDRPANTCRRFLEILAELLQPE